MNQPTHSPDTCTQRDGRWECLHAIDADHFWLGNLMVDLVQIRFEAESLNRQAAKSRRWDVHERNRVVGNLRRIADSLTKGEYKDRWAKWAGWTVSDLLDASKHGLHTGYTEIPDRKER